MFIAGVPLYWTLPGNPITAQHSYASSNFREGQRSGDLPKQEQTKKQLSTRFASLTHKNKRWPSSALRHQSQRTNCSIYSITCCLARALPILTMCIHFLRSTPARGQTLSDALPRRGASAHLLPCFKSLIYTCCLACFFCTWSLSWSALVCDLLSRWLKIIFKKRIAGRASRLKSWQDRYSANKQDLPPRVKWAKPTNDILSRTKTFSLGPCSSNVHFVRDKISFMGVAHLMWYISFVSLQALLGRTLWACSSFSGRVY